jgi:hypothetical protein
VIFLCTIGITFPLSLYRDIAKLAKVSAFALVALTIIILAVMIEAPRTRIEEQGDPKLRWTFINSEIFQVCSKYILIITSIITIVVLQSIGVICFGELNQYN